MSITFFPAGSQATPRNFQMSSSRRSSAVRVHKHDFNTTEQTNSSTEAAAGGWWVIREHSPPTSVERLCPLLWQTWVVGLVAGSILLLDAHILVYAGWVSLFLFSSMACVSASWYPVLDWCRMTVGACALVASWSLHVREKRFAATSMTRIVDTFACCRI